MIYFKKILSSILVILYCVFIAFVFGFLMRFVSIYIMFLNWIKFFYSIIVITPLLFGFISTFSLVVCAPVVKSDHYKISLYIGIIPLLLSAFNLYIFIWNFDFDYTFLKIMLALSLTFEVTLIYYPIIKILYYTSTNRMKIE